MKESINLRRYGYTHYENAVARKKVESTVCPDCNSFLSYCGLINEKVTSKYKYLTIRIFGTCVCGFEVEF